MLQRYRRVDRVSSFFCCVVGGYWEAARNTRSCCLCHLMSVPSSANHGYVDDAGLSWSRVKVRHVCDWSSRGRAVPPPVRSDTARAHELPRTSFLSFSLSRAASFLSSSPSRSKDTLDLLERRGATVEWWPQRFGAAVEAGSLCIYQPFFPFEGKLAVIRSMRRVCFSRSVSWLFFCFFVFLFLGFVR